MKPSRSFIEDEGYMNSYILHLSAADDRRAIHAAFAEEFGFPAFYGNNLDALFDLLSALTEDTHLTVLVKNLGLAGSNSYLQRTFGVLEWASQENPHFSCQIGNDPETPVDPEDFFAPHNDF